MDVQAVNAMAQTIQTSDDLVQAANRIAQQYGNEANPPEIVRDVLDGIISMQAETKGQPIDDAHYQQLVDRHIPNLNQLHNAMFSLKQRADQSGTQVFPSGATVDNPITVEYEEVTDEDDDGPVRGDTRVYDPDEHGNDTTDDEPVRGDTRVYRD